jgi:hypothetical protein
MKREGVTMKGFAILFNEDHTITIFEEVEKEELDSLCDDEKKAVFWREEDIDWNYGY